MSEKDFKRYVIRNSKVVNPTAGIEDHLADLSKDEKDIFIKQTLEELKKDENS